MHGKSMVIRYLRKQVEDFHLAEISRAHLVARVEAHLRAVTLSA